MSNQVQDPWDRASNPSSLEGQQFWGQLTIDAWLGAFQDNGTGKKAKVPFDPALHDRPVTILDLDVIPLAEMNIRGDKLFKKQLIAEFEDWKKTIWPSLRDLGIVNLKDAKGHWFVIEFVPQLKDPSWNVFKFVKMFATQDECRADYLAATGGTQAPAPIAQAAAAPAAAPVNGAEKAAAFQFAKVIVNNVMRASTGQPLDETMTAVGKKLAEYPNVNKFFTADSPEVVELMMAGVK